MSYSAQQTLASFTKLKETLSGEIVCPGDEGYEYGIARWSDSCTKQAAYVVFPKTNEDVAESIKFAREQNLELAVCCGGHSFSGSSSTEGGVAIHLGKYINYARCDPEKRLLYVGGGATWEVVERVGMEHGLATVAGSVNHTGVGGLALGGGYGWLTGRYGMTVDNIVQLTVVLATGEVLTADEKEHPDLFWACRGGGGNFGVVTEFVFKAHPQRPTVFVTYLLYAMDKLESVLNAIGEWEMNAGPDEGVHWGCLRVLPGMKPGTPNLLVIFFYNGEAAEGRKAAKMFYDVGPMVEKAMEELPFSKLNSLQNDADAHGGRKYIKGLPNRSTPPVEAIQAVLQAQDELIKSHPSLVHCGIVYDASPKQAVLAVPLEATAYAGRGTGCQGILISFYKDPSLDDVVRSAVRQWAKIMTEMTEAVVNDAGKAAESVGICYSNLDPEASSSDPSTVFGPNYPRLREVKRMYDPENIWNKWHPIEPAELPN